MASSSLVNSKHGLSEHGLRSEFASTQVLHLDFDALHFFLNKILGFFCPELFITKRQTSGVILSLGDNPLYLTSVTLTETQTHPLLWG